MDLYQDLKKLKFLAFDKVLNEIIKGSDIKKVTNETKKYLILTPPNHNMINPLNAINIDVPRSG